MSNMYTWLETVLQQEYRFIRNIKRAENNTINVMENIHNNRRVIVKYITGGVPVYEHLINLQHDNLPIVYEVVSDNGKSIVVEEFIDGITVGEVLETGLYNDDGVYRVIKEVCEALYVLHGKGIIHRDIKPENIIIDRNGNVKLIDFNISRINIHKQSKDTVVLGTTGYASPEQYGISDTDRRSDIYSVGILINVMLTGDHPAKRMCTGRWQKIVNRCTRINPDERYQDIEELMKNIR